MMKRIVILVSVWLLAVMQLAAQNLKATDFNLLSNSTLASTKENEKWDKNHEKCAIIKVQSSIRGFQFDTGLKFLAGQEEPSEKHPFETWIWVSPGLQNITIRHENFGQCKYQIPIDVEGGRTYEMKLSIGSGRFVLIRTAPEEGATLTIDGKEVGKSPVYNHFLTLGTHFIVAKKDKYEGALERVITESDVNGAVIEVKMENMSNFYGDVIVDVDGRADIFFEGKLKGTGQWRTQLKAGKYAVETRKDNCDPQNTTFTVIAGKENRIVANAPVPHTGYLNIYTRPRNLMATIDGNPIDLSERQVVAVGNHQVEFKKKGYVPERREYRIARNVMITDTVQLERIKYVKPLAFYFGGGYTLGSITGITGMLGAVIQRNDLQLSYTFGASESDPIHWYGNNGTWLATTKYKKSGLAVKYGYQFNLQQMLAITPQVGFSHVGLSGTVSEGTGNYADGASAQLATIGVKLLLVPVHHLYVFAAPQYGVTLFKSTNFDLLSSHSDISVDGFSATLGVLFNF